MLIINEKVLLTGGSGRLGEALLMSMPSIAAPSHQELDVTDISTIEVVIKKYQPQVFIHAAAFTDVAGAESKRNICWQVNVEGTRNIVKALLDKPIKLIHISTDYVFWGDKGNYNENDTVGPVRNYYSLSKLAAEEIVRILPNHLVIRTSFRPKAWPYPKAFDDVYTSQDYVDVIAPEISIAIQNHQQIPYNTVHIATERKSVYELAKRRAGNVERSSKQSAKVELPDDISLDISLWQSLKKQW